MELPNFITRTDGRLRIDTRLGFEALFAPAASNSITEQLDVADLQIREYAPSIAHDNAALGKTTIPSWKGYYTHLSL